MAILDEKTVDFISSGAEQTVRLGVRLGELLRVGDVVCLSGDLGSGKTTMAQGIGRGWGAGRHVTSPSYLIVHEHPRLRDGTILYHIDCYRLETEAEIVTAGLEELIYDGGAVMIEWPERIEALLPPDRLWIELRYVNVTRRGLRARAEGTRSEKLLGQFKRSAFGV